jgi:peptidoglycan hydrolase-like protein with peptidoglycan-binding domain
LVTRRTERDRIISVQYLLSSMGYLESQKFSGRLGNATVAAIKNFQKANGLTETGTYTAGLAKKVYEVAGKDEPPTGHLFVRQDLKPSLTHQSHCQTPNTCWECMCLPPYLLQAIATHNGW